MGTAQSPESVVREISRRTRKKYGTEEIHGFNFVDRIGLVYWRNDQSGIGKGSRETLILVDYSVKQKGL